jgi:hypothetical protein
MLTMKLPELEKTDQYQGLYVFDFGEHTGVGFTAQEVAELLESERFQHGKVYKIHQAYPDGKLELKGVSNQTFQLEAGMFFYAQDEESAQANYKALIGLAVANCPPCRAKVHLAKCAHDSYVVAMIYPAENDDDVSAWFLAGQYQTAGLAEGGIDAVQAYYERDAEILERHQLFGDSSHENRTGDALLLNLKQAVQR